MFFEKPFSAAGVGTQLQIEALRAALGPGVDPAHDYSKVQRGQGASPEKKAQAQKEQVRPPSANLALLRAKLNPGSAAAQAHVRSVSEGSRASSRGPAKPARRPSSAFLREGRKDVCLASEGPEPGQYHERFVVRPKSGGGAEMPGTRAPSKVRASRNKVRPGEEPDGLALAEKAKPHVYTCWIGKTPGRPDLLKTANIKLTDSYSVDHIDEAFEARTEALRPPSWDFGKLTRRGQGDPKPSGVSEPGKYNPNVDLVKAKLRMAYVAMEKQVPRKGLATSGPDRKMMPSGVCDALSGTRRVPCYDFANLQPRQPLISVAEDLSGQTHEYADMHKADMIRSHRTRPRAADSFAKQPSRVQDLKCRRMYVPSEDLTGAGPKTTDDLPEDYRDRPMLCRRQQCFTDMARTTGRFGGERKHGVPAARMVRSHSAGAWRRDKRAGEADAHGGQPGFSQLAIQHLRARRNYEAMPEDIAMDLPMPDGIDGEGGDAEDTIGDIASHQVRHVSYAQDVYDMDEDAEYQPGRSRRNSEE